MQTEMSVEAGEKCRRRHTEEVPNRGFISLILTRSIMFNGENERCLSSVKTIKQLIWLSTLGINHSTTSYDPIRPERFGAASSMIVFLDSSSFSRRKQRLAT